MTQKYQKEIEDLLGQINADRPAEQQARAPGRSTPRLNPRRAGRAAFAFRVSAGRVFLAGIALLLTGAVLRAFVPEVSGYIIWAGICLFVVAYIMFFIRPRRTHELRWRGRPIDDGVGPNPAGRLWRWLNRD